MASIAAIGGDDFLLHVMRVRSEIRDKFLKAHKVLQDKFIGDVIIQKINHLSIIKDGLTV